MKKMMFSIALAAVALMATALIAAADDAPLLKGTAYVAGHGGHLAVINLSTWDLDRIVITHAGSETEGVIAGLHLDAAHKKPGGGTHGGALVGRDLFVGLLDGRIKKYNLDTEKLTDLGQVGEKFCGAIPGPGGKNIYYEDMADGDVYQFNIKKEKKADVIPVGKSVCGIAWTKDGKTAFVSDMVQGKVFVLDWKTKKKIGEIPVGTFIHQIRMNPAHTELWVSAPNEFVVTAKGPVPSSVAGKGKSQIVIIDVNKRKVKDRINLTDDQLFPHDFAFTPDGKYVLLSCRTYSDDSILAVMNVKTHKIVKEVSICKRCHEQAGVKIQIDNGSPLLCGIAVDWGKNPE